MVYRGTGLELDHFDLYRLADPDQIEDTGIYDALGADGVCVIEWGERFSEQIGPERVDVFVTRVEGQAAAGEEPPREVRLVSHDSRGEDLLEALA